MSINEENSENDINNKNPQNSFIYSLQRDKEYINSLYNLKKSILIEKNIEKIYGSTHEKNFNVIITKYCNKSFKNNSIEYSRLKSTTELIEENTVLVENLWLEEVEENSDIYNLYISEFTKLTYRNEYNLISLNHYFNLNHTESSYNQNIMILLQLLQKIKSIHENNNFAMLNLSPNNIFFNKNDHRIYFAPPKLAPILNSPTPEQWYTPPEECYVEKKIFEEISNGIKYDIWSIGCILCEMFFVVTPVFQTFSRREKMKKIIDILGVPKIEDVDYMSNQEFSFIQSTNEDDEKNYNKLKEILLVDNNEINFNSVNCNIKKLILEIITKCLCYNRNKRISLDEMINQIDYMYDRYIKEKPMKIDATNIINRDNLFQLNAPIINISLNPYNSKKSNLNSLNSLNSNTYNIYNNENDTNINNELSNDENNENIETENNINNEINTDMIKNYDSFISERYSTMMNNNNINNNNNNELIEDKFQNFNNNYINKINLNKNFSKFASLSSISSNKNYNNNKNYLTSLTTNNGNNYGHNFSNITEQSLCKATEINKKIKENEDAEYAKLQNRKYIFF